LYFLLYFFSYFTNFFWFPLSPLLAYQVPLRPACFFLSFSLWCGGAPGYFPRPPTPTVSSPISFLATQHEYNTTSMGGPSGRDLNPADLAVVSEEIHTHIYGPAEVPSLEKILPLR
jgi:hypothetical protein